MIVIMMVARYAVVESRDNRTPPRWSGTSCLNVPQLLRKGFRYEANGLTSLCDDFTFGLALGLGLGLRLGLGLGLGLRLGVRGRIRVRVRVYEAPDHLGGARLSADSKSAVAMVIE